jgi:hypothetical protein
MVEGPKRPTHLQNSRQNTLHIPKHLTRWNPHHCESHILQENIRFLIPSGTIPTIMRLAINLDRQPHLKASEVDQEPILRTLLPKLEPARPLPKFLPERHLRQAHLFPQLPR